MNRRLNLFLFLLLTACAPAPSVVALPEAAATQFVIAPEPTATSILPLPTATLIPCDPAAEEFCIVEGNFIFQNPLGPDSVLAIAGNYSYGSTDEVFDDGGEIVADPGNYYAGNRNENSSIENNNWICGDRGGGENSHEKYGK